MSLIRCTYVYKDPFPIMHPHKSNIIMILCFTTLYPRFCSCRLLDRFNWNSAILLNFCGNPQKALRHFLRLCINLIPVPWDHRGIKWLMYWSSVPAVYIRNIAYFSLHTHTYTQTNRMRQTRSLAGWPQPVKFHFNLRKKHKRMTNLVHSWLVRLRYSKKTGEVFCQSLGSGVRGPAAAAGRRSSAAVGTNARYATRDTARHRAPRRRATNTTLTTPPPPKHYN